MNLPTIQADNNFTTVFTDNMTLWFSYSTLIAFRIGAEKVVSENVWSKTTGKHLNAISDKESRVKHDVFLAKWKEMTEAKAPMGLLG